MQFPSYKEVQCAFFLPGYRGIRFKLGDTRIGFVNGRSRRDQIFSQFAQEIMELLCTPFRLITSLLWALLRHKGLVGITCIPKMVSVLDI
jgi:hypothetical protein